MSLHDVKIVSKSRHEAPSYQTAGASGMDVRAVLEVPLTLAPMHRALVPTGIFIEIDQSLECQVRPRSGLALKKGITVLNTPGTIDADYRGELGIILVNLSAEDVTIIDGERIAQLVFCKVEKVNLIQVQELGSSERGDGGFGSTGVK